jgi:hypothetical protein
MKCGDVAPLQFASSRSPRRKRYRLWEIGYAVFVQALDLERRHFHRVNFVVQTLKPFSFLAFPHSRNSATFGPPPESRHQVLQ